MNDGREGKESGDDRKGGRGRQEGCCMWSS